MSLLTRRIRPTTPNRAVAKFLGVAGLIGAIPGISFFGLNQLAMATSSPSIGALGIFGLGIGYLGLALTPWYLLRRANLRVGEALAFWIVHAMANLSFAVWFGGGILNNANGGFDILVANALGLPYAAVAALCVHCAMKDASSAEAPS